MILVWQILYRGYLIAMKSMVYGVTVKGIRISSATKTGRKEDLGSNPIAPIDLIVRSFPMGFVEPWISLLKYELGSLRKIHDGGHSPPYSAYIPRVDNWLS